MNREALEKKVMELVAMVYGCDVGTLTTAASFKEDLKGASFKMVGLVSELENELDVMVSLQDASACATIGELIDKVEEEMV